MLSPSTIVKALHSSSEYLERKYVRVESGDYNGKNKASHVTVSGGGQGSNLKFHARNYSHVTKSWHIATV